MNQNSKKTINNKYRQFLPLFKEEKTQNITTLILTLVALALFGFFAINPTIATIVQLRKQLTDSKFVNLKLEEKIANLTTLQHQYNFILPDLPLVYQALPQQPTVPLLTAQLQALATSNNVALSRLQVFQVELTQKANANPQANYGSFAFNLDIEGTYVNVTKFLSSLINFERVTTIDSLSIISGKTSEAQLSIRGKAYFKP